MDKDPRKEARRQFRKWGGTVLNSSPHSTSYQFPDGSIFVVPHNSDHAHVARILREARARFGQTVSGDRGLTAHRNKPVIDFERLTASQHARERLELMKAQNPQLHFRDVLLTLRLPERVLYSSEHNSWVWIRGDLAIPIAETGGGFTITTVLWSDTELFRQYPRPLVG